MKFDWNDAIVGVGLLVLGGAIYVGGGVPWLLAYLGVLLIVVGMAINPRR